MALREKLGRLVLLDETEVSVLGREYRAARLGPTGLDRLVTVLCFAPSVSSQAAVTKKLMDEARLAAKLQNPGLVRVLGIGRVEQTFYVSTELVEGRTLASIFERCQRESFPFAADHALMVASRVATALEYLHGKKDDSGSKLFHGLLTPSRVVVSYDGEVKLKGLGLWSALRETEVLGAAERAYIAPEQAIGTPGDPRSDVYALGLMMLHALTGRAPDGRDPRALLAEAKVVNVSGESAPVPKLLSETLQRALADEPAGRYPSMAEMRKAIDTLLFSGDFTPTTFDLAFFMHTLFRDDMDQEARAIDEARRGDYREFLDGASDTGGRAASSAPVVNPAPTEPMVAVPTAPAIEPTVMAPPVAPPPQPMPRVEPQPVPSEPVAARSELPLVPPPASRSELPLVPPPAPNQPIRSTPAASFATPAAHDASGGHAPADHHASGEHHPPSRATRETAGRDPSVRLSLGAPEQPSSRKGLWLAIAGAVVVVAIGGGAWFAIARRPAPAPTPVPLTPEAVAALAKVKELENRLADLQKQSQEAEQKAAEEAAEKLRKQAEARGRAVDEAALKAAQERARQQARAEQEARQQQELRRLAEAKRAEEARLAAEMKAAETPPPPVATAPPPTEAPAATATTAPAAAVATPEAVPSPTNTPTQPGALVSHTDPKLVPPLMLSGNNPVYPPLAMQQRIEGSVDVSVLIDENGRVAEVTVVRAKPRGVGFEAAATQALRSRRYRPGTKDGVPVRVWLPLVINFKRPR